MQVRMAPAASQTAAARSDAPVAARLLRGDLDAIVAKALRAEPAARYTTVEAMKRDVERARRGQAVSAREGARLYALGRLLRHYRWAAASAAAVFVALAAGLGVAAWQARSASVQRDLALREAAREEALRDHLTGLFRNAIAEHGTEAPTAKNMLDRSAQRVLREYRDQPRLAGQVVVTLADLYDALQDVQGSAALLEGFLAQAGANADRFEVAVAQQKLAGIEVMRGHFKPAGELLERADAFWSHESRPHAEERLEWQAVHARWMGYYGKTLSVTGRQDPAIEALTAAVDIGGRYAGADSPVTLQNRLFMGEAQLAKGYSTAARATLDAVRQTALDHYGAGFPLSLRSQIALASVDELEAHFAAAAARLPPVIDALRKLGPSGSSTLSQALVVSGEVELARHRPSGSWPRRRSGWARR